MAKKIIKKASKKVTKKAVKKAIKKIVKKAAAPVQAAPAEVVKFVLRLDPATHQAVKKAAEANNTSMNKEICNTLQAGNPVLTKLDEILARLPAKKR